jgi:N-acetyl-gamma-glutamyl-phosphate reductase
LLLGHPGVELVSVTSRQYAGQSVAQLFPRFSHFPASRTLRFKDPKIELLAKEAEIVFLALPHGVAAEFAVPLLAMGARVVDLSADFRIKDPAIYQEFYGHAHPAAALLAQAVYGLPEVYRTEIQKAVLVACPGCFPTSILLPVLPLLRAGLIDPHRIIADSLSGVTGAGRKVEASYLFAECNESLRPYGVPKHRHLSEIEQELSLAAGTPIVVQFTPHLVPVNRGILTTLYLEFPNRGPDRPGDFLEEMNLRVGECYEQAYRNEPFVRLLGDNALPDTKNVVGTNFIEIAWRIDPRTGRLIVLSAEDNIVKGTSGQAVQCLNIICGLPETTGLC